MNTAARYLYRKYRLKRSGKFAVQNPKLMMTQWSRLQFEKPQLFLPGWIAKQPLREENRSISGFGSQSAGVADALQMIGQVVEITRETVLFVSLKTQHIVADSSVRGDFCRQGFRVVQVAAATRMNQQVRSMLLIPTLSIKEIASRAGFGSANFMSRSFRKYFGLTPRDERQRLTRTERHRSGDL